MVLPLNWNLLNNSAVSKHNDCNKWTLYYPNNNVSSHNFILTTYCFSPSWQVFTAACLDWLIKLSIFFRYSTGDSSAFASHLESVWLLGVSLKISVCICVGLVLASGKSTPFVKDTDSVSTGMKRDSFKNIESFVYSLFSLLICSIYKDRKRSWTYIMWIIM